MTERSKSLLSEKHCPWLKSYKYNFHVTAYIYCVVSGKKAIGILWLFSYDALIASKINI